MHQSLVAHAGPCCQDDGHRGHRKGLGSSGGEAIIAGCARARVAVAIVGLRGSPELSEALRSSPELSGALRSSLKSPIHSPNSYFNGMSFLQTLRVAVKTRSYRLAAAAR
eukprot:15438704-Alexandrium_andersonii.AAC.1